MMGRRETKPDRMVLIGGVEITPLMSECEIPEGRRGRAMSQHLRNEP